MTQAFEILLHIPVNSLSKQAMPHMKIIHIVVVPS